MMRGHAPSFQKYVSTSPQASAVMAANKSADTKCERLLRSELWKRGMRFRKNVSQLPGRPDIVFPRARLVVFCDGDFWHGRNRPTQRRKLRRGPNADYWISKIKRNIQRDRHNDKRLRQLGWKVVRLWELDILNSPSRSAKRVARALSERR